MDGPSATSAPGGMITESACASTATPAWKIWTPSARYQREHCEYHGDDGADDQRDLAQRPGRPAADGERDAECCRHAGSVEIVQPVCRPVAHQIQHTAEDRLHHHCKEEEAEVDLEDDSDEWRHERDQRHQRTHHRQDDEGEPELLMQRHPVERGNHQSGQYCSSRIALLSNPARRMMARAPLIIPGWPQRKMPPLPGRIPAASAYLRMTSSTRPHSPRHSGSSQGRLTVGT